MQHPGQLHRDVTATGDGDPSRTGAQLEKAVGGDAELSAGYLGNPWSAAGGDDQMVGAIALIAHRQSAGVGETAESTDQFDPRLGQIAQVPFVDVAHESIAGGLELFPVEAEIIQSEAIAGRIVERMSQMGGVPHDFLGHAADIDTGAAEPVGFDQGTAGTVASGPFRHRQAATTAADDDQVVVLGHASSE